MNRKSIKLIKRQERQRRRRAKVEPIVNKNRWSTAVRSWIAEFQQRDRDESLPAFDSLFKDALPEPGSTEQ